MLKLLDLYCGMGGLSFGFAYALKDAEILGLDIDEKAVETYNLNLSKYRAGAEKADVFEWEPRGGYDIVFGGSPCQPFSIANSKKKGERHELFPTLSRFFDIVEEIKPKAFLLENVKGATSRKNKPFLEQQLEKVKNDYALDYRVLNAAFYGVPQRRERLIVIGVRSDLGRKPIFPEPTHAEKEATRSDGKALHRWLTLGEAIGDLLLIPPYLESPHELRFVSLRREQIERIRREREEPDLHGHWGKMEFPDSLDKPSRTISSHAIEGTKRETIVLPLVPDHVMTPSGGWANRKSDWGSRVMRLESPAYTITEKHRSGQLVPVHGKGSAFRRLTVRECMRIQSFPDWWIFPEGVSVSRKYKLVGEAVPPILAYRLAVALGTTLGLEVNLNPKKEDWQLPYFERAFCR